MEITVEWNRWWWLESDLPEQLRIFFFIILLCFLASSSGESPTHVLSRDLSVFITNFGLKKKIKKSEERSETLPCPWACLACRYIFQVPSIRLKHQHSSQMKKVGGSNTRAKAECRRFSFSFAIRVLYRRASCSERLFHPSILPFHVIYSEYRRSSACPFHFSPFTSSSILFDGNPILRDSFYLSTLLLVRVDYVNSQW